METTIDVLVATGRNRLPEGLIHCPWPIDIHADIGPGWAMAANRLLDIAAANGRDALFLDDDVTLHERSFDMIERHYDAAEVLGFHLRTPGGGRSAGWEFTGPDAMMVAPTGCQVPCYLAHVTTSCVFLKASVAQAGARFPVWDGAWYEDVAFTFECWLRGQRVAYVGGEVDHLVGTTKLAQPESHGRSGANLAVLQQWILDHDLKSKTSIQCEPGKIPLGAILIE